MTSTQSDTQPQTWYIFKRSGGICEIVSGEAVLAAAESPEEAAVEQWGPFASPAEAIAKRVGLIRAGKCQPVTESGAGGLA